MAAAPAFMLGFSELLILLSGGLLGLPPGERDAAFLHCAPTDTLIYMEWAERSAGKLGASGIDGLVADPEVKAFVEHVERAILTAVKKETESGGPEEQILAKALPLLIKSILNRSGCLYLSYDEKKAANEKQDVERQVVPFASWATILLRLKVTLVINGGNQADEFAEALKELLQLLPENSTKKGLNKQAIPLPIPGASLILHRHQNYFVFGLGDGTIDRVIAGLSGETKGLGDNERANRSMKAVAMARTAQVTWLDIKGLLDTVSKAMGDQGQMVTGIAAMIGADSIDSITTTIGVIDGKIRTRSLISTDGRTEGILALASGRAIKPADLSLVPADADFVAALSLNAEKLLSTVTRIIGAADPGSKELFEQLLAEVEAGLNVSFEDDIFKAFGDVWVIHDSPAAGGIFITSLVASLEVRDPRKARDVLSKLMAVLKDNLPGERAGGFRRRAVFLAEKKFMDQTIYFVNTIGDDIPFAPALCVTDKQLLVAPHPQALKAHLRFLASREASFASRLQKDLKLPEGDLICFTYFDSKSLVRYIYAAAPYFGQVILSMIQSQGGEIDIFSLPSARAIMPYVSDSIATVVRTPDGILSDSQSGIPIPGGVGLLQPFFIFGVSVIPVRMIRIQGARDVDGDEQNDKIRSSEQTKARAVRRGLARKVVRSKKRTAKQSAL